MRSRLVEYESNVNGIAAQAMATAGKRAAILREELASARRRWIRSGHLLQLELKVKDAVRRYANDMETADRAVRDQLVTQAAAFGSDVSIQQRLRSEPPISRLTTEDRNVRATSGSLKIVRRAVWKRWYLPGLATLEKEGLDADLAGQKSWVQSAAGAALAAGQAKVNERLVEVAARADEDSARIKAETHFDTYAAELEHLAEGLPSLAAQVTNVQELARQARALMQ